MDRRRFLNFSLWIGFLQWAQRAGAFAKKIEEKVGGSGSREVLFFPTDLNTESGLKQGVIVYLEDADWKFIELGFAPHV